MGTEIEKRQETAIEFVQRCGSEFGKVLPKHMTADRMTRLALSALRTNKNLAQCTVQSVAVSLMACSVLGLEPNTPQGHAYLIPFKKECTLVIGYRGMIELFYRSGAVSSAQAFSVFKGDDFKVELGLDRNLVHIPCNAPDRCQPDKLTHVYSVIDLKEPGVKPIWGVLDRYQIEQHRARSMARDSGPWKTDYIKMAEKTAIRDIARFVPFSIEKVSVAAAYEGAHERGQVTVALSSLGDEAFDLTKQLVGDLEDSQPEERGLDAITEKLKSRSTIEPEVVTPAEERLVPPPPKRETTEVEREPKPQLELPKGEKAKLMAEIQMIAREKYGDAAMLEISRNCARLGFPNGYTGATLSELSSLLDEFNMLIS